MSRVNFASDQVGNLDQPGVQAIIQRLSALGSTLSPEALVDNCLDLLGPLEVLPETRNALLAKAGGKGDARWGSAAEKAEFTRRVAEMLQLIVATREYQFA